MQYKVKTIKKETLWQRYFRMDCFHISHELFDGSMSETFTREVLERGHAVAVLPYDPIADKILLIEQFRAGALASMDHPDCQSVQTHSSKLPWMYEIVAGIIDNHEDPEIVAKREAKEEAGIDLTNLTLIQPYYPSAGAVSEVIYLYVAQIDSSKAGGVFGVDGEFEDIKSHIFDTSHVWNLLDQGEIINSAALISLQWLRIHKEKLLKQWQIPS